MEPLSEDWELLAGLLPRGWEQQAILTGASERVRGFPTTSSLLRTLLLHVGKGYSLRETVVRARAAGAVGVLIKPVSAADLNGEISRLFSRPQVCAEESQAFAAEMAALSAGASQEIGRRGRALLSDAETIDDVALAAEAHRLGGLAGQFGARDVAAAALRLEADLGAPDASRAAGLAALAQALADFQTTAQ